MTDATLIMYSTYYGFRSSFGGHLASRRGNYGRDIPITSNRGRSGDACLSIGHYVVRSSSDFPALTSVELDDMRERLFRAMRIPRAFLEGPGDYSTASAALRRR